jgi:5-methyltetrahydrofolate--homocysteine methyltransferase
MSHLLDALRSGRVLLMDGAMGTELQRAGLQPGERGELWNLAHAERVRTIHRSYADAGAEVLLTNTFQADPVNLAKKGSSDHFDAVWEAAIGHARNACPAGGWVLADVGPLDSDGVRLAEKALSWVVRQADGLLIETLSGGESNLLSFYASYTRVNPAIEFLISFTFLKTPDGTIETIRGESPETCAWKAYRLGVDALGANCGRNIGMADIAEVIRRYRQRLGDRLPLFARPNAGTPEQVGDRLVYPRTPEMMADGLHEVLEAGVNMFGGCCGTTPAHLAAFKRVVDAWNGR